MSKYLCFFGFSLAHLQSHIFPSVICLASLIEASSSSKLKRDMLPPYIVWCRRAESNCPHVDFQSTALPTELLRRKRVTAGLTEPYIPIGCLPNTIGFVVAVTRRGLIVPTPAIAVNRTYESRNPTSE